MSGAARPFLKCQGGKTKLLPELLARIPERFSGTYHEPFFGGGALFFELMREPGTLSQAFLNDNNEHLIQTMRTLRADPYGVVAVLSRMKKDEDSYYRVRAQKPESLPLAKQAARYIYLNKCGFNGMHRVNKAGQFNVPWGKNSKANVCDEENLHAVADAIQSAELSSVDFEQAMEKARRGDLLYADSPYEPLTKTSNFVAYTKEGFTFADQTRLMECAKRLKKRGVKVLLSNSSAPSIRAMYEANGFLVEEVYAARSINSNGDKRQKVAEVLIR